MGRSTFKAKRTDTGSNPEVKPGGTKGNKGSVSQFDGRKNTRGGPTTPSRDPFWKKPADVLRQPKSS